MARATEAVEAVEAVEAGEAGEAATQAKHPEKAKNCQISSRPKQNSSPACGVLKALPPDSSATMSMLGGIRTHMESKGYGWAFDVEDDDDDGEEKRPLMEELEIDPTDIILKAKCVFMPPRDGLGLIQDFWGPLSIVLLYASLLVWGQMAVVSWILSLWLGGSWCASHTSRTRTTHPNPLPPPLQ